MGLVPIEKLYVMNTLKESGSSNAPWGTPALPSKSFEFQICKAILFDLFYTPIIKYSANGSL